MKFLKTVKKLLFQKRYKVTRTWYVWAASPTEAISRTQYISHDKVESLRALENEY